MKIQTRKLYLGLAFVAALLAAAPAAQATAISWNISGPGATSATQVDADSWTTHYDQPGYGATRTWVVSGVAGADGDYSFDWNFSGFHSWYMASASLQAELNGSITDTLFPWSGVAGGFNVSGAYTFDDVHGGDILGFVIQGYNYDSSAIIVGDLALDQTSEIPEPSTLALLGLSLGGLAVARRRKTA